MLSKRVYELRSFNMSRNDTLSFFLGLLLIAAAPATAGASALSDCVRNGLIAEGINPALQSKWNTNLPVGQIHADIVRICMKSLKLSEAQTAPAEAQVVPVNYQTEDAPEATGIREI